MREPQLMMCRTQLRRQRKRATKGLHQTYTAIFLSAMYMFQAIPGGIIGRGAALLFQRRTERHGGEASATSPISLLMMAWPKDSKSCATTLSMQIRDLERELRAELVERRQGRVGLTQIEAEVARRARNSERHQRSCRLRSRQRPCAQRQLAARCDPDARPLCVAPVAPGAAPPG
jgi:hypothetical protein